VLSAASPSAIVALRAELADRTVVAVRALCDECGLAPESLAAVALHGQTLWHEPPLGSWQLSDPARVAEQLGVGVVSDFRSRDIAAGGTGAPLVPLADALLFGHPERPRALLNIGGMANVTLVPQRGRLADVRAFDTGPGVAVIDTVVRTLTGADFDRDGALADAGRPIDALLAALLRDPYFDLAPPKSTGRERFGAAFAARLIGECQRIAPQCTVADIVATATALTVQSIVGQCTRFVSTPLGDMLVSGGGVHNRTLLESLRAALAPVTLRRFDEVFFDGDAKEAVAFAYLAWRHGRDLPGNVPSATGARGPRILGTWTPA
jgi:anhydro-N-acetylmuramic acid kinase